MQYKKLFLEKSRTTYKNKLQLLYKITSSAQKKKCNFFK